MFLEEAQARCTECDWITVYCKNAMGLGAQHNKKTGHSVHVELSFIQIFEKKVEKQINIREKG